jgi:hypothetical protein
MNRRMAALLAAVLSGQVLFSAAVDRSPQARSAEETLREIYLEVLAMGPYPGQGIIHRDFFIGEDDDDTNKYVHAAVVISGEDGSRRMTVRISWMERIPDDPKAYRAGLDKSLACAVEGDAVRLIRTEFAEKEWSVLAAGLLKAVRDKKKILALIKN